MWLRISMLVSWPPRGHLPGPGEASVPRGESPELFKQNGAPTPDLTGPGLRDFWESWGGGCSPRPRPASPVAPEWTAGPSGIRLSSPYSLQPPSCVGLDPGPGQGWETDPRPASLLQGGGSPGAHPQMHTNKSNQGEELRLVVTPIPSTASWAKTWPPLCASPFSCASAVTALL